MKPFHSFFAAVCCFSFCIAQPAAAQEPVAVINTATSDYWYPVIMKGKLGYMDSQGNLRINAELERQESYKLNNVTGPFIKADINDKVALFDRAGKLVLDAKYSDIVVDTATQLIRVSQPESEGFSFMNDVVGFVDYSGKTVIPVSYHTQLFTGGYRFEEGLWCFQKDGLQGYMDKTGAVVIAPQFNAAADFKNGLASAQKDVKGNWGFIDRSGKFRISPAFASAGSFDEAGYAMVRINSTDPTFSIINNKGKFMTKNIPYQASGGFMDYPAFHHGLFAVYDTVQKKYGYMDHNGKLAIPIQFDYALDFDQDGRALVNMGSVTDGKGWLATHKGGKWAFIDTHGNLSVPYFRAEEVGGFQEGLSTVKMNGLWGFINEKGEVVIEPQWTERPTYFEGGLARVFEPSKLPSDKTYVHYVAVGYINKQGKYVWPIQE